MYERIKTMKLDDLRNEKFRMECAYDNLYTDSGLYRTYQEICRMIRDEEHNNKEHGNEERNQ